MTNEESSPAQLFLRVCYWSIVLFCLPILTVAAVIDHVRGYIVLQVEENGEAWYVDPSNDVRYYLGRPDDAFEIMRMRGLGISNIDLEKIPIVGTGWDAPTALRNHVRGRILLQVEEHGEAWYVYPKNDKRYYLGRPSDAFNIMRSLGLGITNENLEQIPTTESPADPEVTMTQQQVSTSRGEFNIQLVTLQRDTVTMVTDTAAEEDCEDNCPAKPLAGYVSENGGIAGIHGTYFCPPDYSNCVNMDYSFNPPVFNSEAQIMINAEKLPFHSGPMMVQHTDGSMAFFHRTIDFGYSVDEYEKKNGVVLQAALANYPSLVEGGNIVVHTEPLDPKQTLKAPRGGIGYNSDSIFLVVTGSASVIDLAYIFEALGAQYALNLDGGGSIALYANGGYQAGPGRLLPNAIVFK